MVSPDLDDGCSLKPTYVYLAVSLRDNPGPVPANTQMSMLKK